MDMASFGRCQPFFPYNPSLALACIGIGIFTVLSGVHIVHTARTRTWDNVFFVIGGLCEATGCIARAYSSNNICSRSAYAAESVLLLIGPTLLMFTVTLVHTTYLRALGAENRAWVPIRFQKPIYLAINSLCFGIQIGGGIDLGTAHTRSLAELGSKLKVAAFVLQMVFWGYILAEHTWITIKLGMEDKKAARQGTTPTTSTSLQARFPHYNRWSHLFGLAIAIISFGRNLMRLTEFGVVFLQRNEWATYAFDVYQAALVMGVFAAFYLPGKVEEVVRANARNHHMLEEMPKNVFEDPVAAKRALSM